MDKALGKEGGGGLESLCPLIKTRVVSSVKFVRPRVVHG